MIMFPLKLIDGRHPRDEHSGLRLPGLRQGHGRDPRVTRLHQHRSGGPTGKLSLT